MNHPKRHRRGANAIEFALLLPLLLAVMTGIMDYGWTYAVRSGANAAARAGARAGAVTAQLNDPDSAAADAAAAHWSGLGLPMTPTMVAFRDGDPQFMVVRVQVDMTSLVGLVAGPGEFEVSAVQRMEEQP